MSIAHLLEDFTPQAGTAKVHLLDDDALEEMRLAAFEEGYIAGWEDALQAQEQGRETLQKMEQWCQGTHHRLQQWR